MLISLCGSSVRGGTTNERRMEPFGSVFSFGSRAIGVVAGMPVGAAVVTGAAVAAVVTGGAVVATVVVTAGFFVVAFFFAAAFAAGVMIVAMRPSTVRPIAVRLNGPFVVFMSPSRSALVRRRRIADA